MKKTHQKLNIGMGVLVIYNTMNRTVQTARQGWVRRNETKTSIKKKKDKLQGIQIYQINTWQAQPDPQAQHKCVSVPLNSSGTKKLNNNSVHKMQPLTVYQRNKTFSKERRPSVGSTSMASWCWVAVFGVLLQWSGLRPPQGCLPTTTVSLWTKPPIASPLRSHLLAIFFLDVRFCFFASHFITISWIVEFAEVMHLKKF